MEQGGLHIILGALAQSGPAEAGHYGYFLFQTLTDLLAVIISSCLFLVMWNSRRFTRNNGLIFIGVSYLFVALVETLHLLVFTSPAAIGQTFRGLAPELWRISRFVQAVSFVIAPLTLDRKLNMKAVLAVYSALVGGLLAAAILGMLPAQWASLRDTGGWLHFWIFFDLVTGTIFVAAAGVFRAKRTSFDPRVVRLLVASAIAMSLAEWAMALYPFVGLPADVAVHCMEIVGFCLIYKAILETGLIYPYRLMFLNLQENEAMLRQSLDESRRQKAETDALLQGTHYIIAEMTFEETAARILSACRALIAAPRGYFVMQGRDGRPRVYSLDGQTAADIPGDVPWDEFIDRVAASREPLWQNNRHEDDQEPDGAHVESFLLVPLLDKGNSFGAFALINKAGGFDTNDQEMGKAFAELVSIAMNDRRSRRELAESAKEFRALVSHVPGAVYRSSFKTHRTMEFMSEKIEEITGYPAADFVESRKRTYVSIIHPADIDTVQDCIRQAIAGRHAYDIEYRIITASGEVRWVRDQGCGNYDDSGALTSLDGAIFDVTVRRLAEDEIQESRRLLEMKVTVRTAELRKTNEQLESQIHERKKLERLVLRASEGEQQRIGQELHDGIGQQLAGLSFMVAALARRLSGRLPQENKSITEILELIQKTINEVRGVAKGLYPVEVRSGGLHTALSELAANTHKLFGLPCSFISDETFEVGDAAVATHVYRIAQEAITNAVKHGKARNIAIHLKRSSGHAILTMANDGDDFRVENVDSGGLGLQIMRYRADVIGGVLEVTSPAEGGTMVKCVFPNESDLIDGRHNGE